jgi:small-conductance mechanosensitive channel
MSVGRRLGAALAALVFVALLAATGAPARAQVMSWWLGGGAEQGAGAGRVAERVSWWLGAGGGGAAGGADGGVAQTVSWWLGTSGEGKGATVPPSQTLGWWLGSAAQADNGTSPDERGESAVPDYATWEGIARAAEAAIETPQTPNLRLEQLRAQIAQWRDRFLTAQNANRTRIDTIRNQISALGPAPEEGATEAPEIAARRAALNEQLATLQAPGIAAEEAYLGADGLIREIDTLLRERQASELLELGPSPLVPVNWPPAVAVLTGLGADLWREAADGWASTTSRAKARETLPLTLLFLVLGAGLLWRGRTWSERLAGRLLAGSGRRAKRVVLALLVSLGQVILPFVGLLLLVAAAVSTGLVGPRGAALLASLPLVGFVILAARWLGQQVFPRDGEAPLLPGLGAERRAEGRFFSTLLGVLLGLAGLLTAMLPFEGDTLTARVVLGFPVLLLGGLILVRLGQILIGASRAAAAGGDAGPRARLLLLIGRAAVGLGILGPLFAAVGYYTAGRFMVFPAALSLALLAFLVILQQLVADLYALATRKGDDEAEEALVPVLISFALALFALPLLALIWGARVSDLTELWARAREGFTVGETRIAPTDFVTFAAVFALGYVATRLVQGALKTNVLPKTRLDPGGQNAIVSGTGYLGVFLAALAAITSAGIDLSSLAILAGALSVGIGFGLQNIVSNFISGIILLVERPINEGDWIEVNGQMGHVRDISVRSTRIETFDRTDVIVPNSDLISGVVTNYTRGNLTGRIIVPVGVAYGSDTRRVEEILREIAEAHPLVSLTPKPAVLFMGFGADALNFEIRVILRDVNFSLTTRSDMNHEIARRFAEDGIEIPFAQRDIWIRNPEALAGAAAAPAAKPKPARRKAPPPAAPQAVDPALRDAPDAEEDET